MADPKKSIIRNYVAKKLYEKGGTIANRKSVDFSTAAMVERLTEFGIDPVSYTHLTLPTILLV